MTQLQNTFEGGTNGTKLTPGSGGNTGGASGDYFTNTPVPTGGILQFTNSRVYRGSLALQMATRATSGSCNVHWNSTVRGQISDDYIRFYFYADDVTLGGVAHQLVRWFANAGATGMAGILLGNGRLYAADHLNGIVLGNSTNLIVAGQWVRIEAYLRARTDGTGYLRVQLFLNPASTTPDWDYTLNDATQPYGYTDDIFFGEGGAPANWPTATGSFYFDGVVTGASNWIGPVPPVVVAPSAGISATSTFGATLSVVRGGGGGGTTTSIYGVGAYGLATYGAPIIHPNFAIAATSTVRGGIGRIQPTPTPTPTPVPYVPPTPPAEVFTEIGSFAQAVYTLLNLDDLLDTDNTKRMTLQFIGAIGSAFQQMDDLAHFDPDVPNDTPWGKLLDVDRVPDEGLAWFGQFMGVTLNPNLDANGQRQQIRDRTGWRRGTVPVITSAIREFLTGTQTVAFIERDTSPYHFNVATYGDETDTFARSIIPNIINDNKPAGLQYTYTIIAGSPATADTYENLFIDFPEYVEVLSDEQSYEDVLLNP